MNILFIGVRKNIEDIISGPQKVANNLYNELIKQHHNVYYYGLYEGETPADKKNINIINYREAKGPLRKIFEYIKGYNIKVVYIARFYSVMAIYVLILKLFYKIKVVYTVHGLVKKEKLINKNFRFYNVWCENLVLKFSDEVVAISHALKEELLEYYPTLNRNKISVINNGVSILPIKNPFNIREAYNIEENKKILFTVGTRKIKNIELLLSSFTQNNKLYASSCLLIAGETDTDYARKLIETYEGCSNVRFIGKLTPEEINNVYEQCDLFVQISEFETFGLSIVEAMLHKKKVVIAESLPIAEYFKAGEAIFYNKSKDDLGKLLLQALSQESSLNEKGYDKAAELFNWSTIAEQYYEVFTRSSDTQALAENGEQI
jgi:glycosyltransferase involved in cell wall biosynthesis